MGREVDRHRRIKRRAKKIQKASKGKLDTKDYLQRALVVLIILVILAAALFFTNAFL